MGTADLRAGAFQLRKWKFREKIEADFGWVDSLRAKHAFCGNNPACTAEQRCVHQPIDVEFICWEKNDVQKNTVTMLRDVRARALSIARCYYDYQHCKPDVCFVVGAPCFCLNIGAYAILLPLGNRTCWYALDG